MRSALKALLCIGHLRIPLTDSAQQRGLGNWLPIHHDRSLTNQADWRRAGVNVHPGLFSRSKHCRYPLVGGELFILVGGSEFCVGDLEYRATHTTVVSAVERDVGMMRLAACSHDLRVLDLH